MAMLAAFQAAPAVPTQDETRVEDIQVDGRPLDQVTNDFVSEIARPAGRRGLARWSNEICVGVVNLPAEHAQAMVDRISDIAADLGLEPGQPGCTPNIVISATDDGAAMARALVRRDRRSFDLGSLSTDAGTRALQEFQSSDRAVRWWQTSIPVDSNTGLSAIRLPGQTGPDGEPSAPVINTFAASRLNSQIRDDLSRVMVIIDVTKLGDTDFNQLIDYVALLSLAQIDARAETQGFDTILNLFNDGGAPSGLTSWDRSYLTGLYASHSQRLNTRALNRAVASDLARGLRSGNSEEN